MWATEQEQPQKTVERWACMGSSSSGAGGPSDDAGSSAGSSGARHEDYLVPWHLPFHRAGAVATAGAGTVAGGSSSSAGAGSGTTGGPSGADLVGGAQAAASSSGSGSSSGNGGSSSSNGVLLDNAKGAVVYQRYYHLFAPGELEALVARVAGVQLLDSFYDRSNWCVVFGKL